MGDKVATKQGRKLSVLLDAALEKFVKRLCRKILRNKNARLFAREIQYTYKFANDSSSTNLQIEQILTHGHKDIGNECGLGHIKKILMDVRRLHHTLATPIVKKII